MPSSLLLVVVLALMSGKSGVFFMERYDIQVLDSSGNSTYSNGQAGAVYKQYIPMVNACRARGGLR